MCDAPRARPAGMTAALVFQLINLGVSVALVPLLLAMLAVETYLLWVLFVTIGGLTLQLEFAVQTMMARRMAPAHAALDHAAYAREDRACRRAFRALALAIMLLVLPAGGLYFSGVGDAGQLAGRAGGRIDDWALPWLLFCSAYAINYSFGHNNVRLIATGRAARFFWWAGFGRLAGFALTMMSLHMGLGLVGLSTAFLCSVVLTVVPISISARGPAPAGASERSPAASADRVMLDQAGLVRYTAFTLVAFLLYRGSFLIVARLFGFQDAAAHGLALQAFAILYALAVTPATVRLSHLVHAVVQQDRDAEDTEIARWLMFAAGALLAGTAGLLLVAQPLLDLIGSDVGLPSRPALILLAAAFLLEAWIFVCINPLLVRRRLDFIRPYVASVTAAVLLASLAALAGVPLAWSMIAIPLMVQLGLAFPLVFVALARSHGRSAAGMARTLVQGGRRAFGT